MEQVNEMTEVDQIQLAMQLSMNSPPIPSSTPALPTTTDNISSLPTDTQPQSSSFSFMNPSNTTHDVFGLNSITNDEKSSPIQTYSGFGFTENPSKVNNGEIEPGMQMFDNMIKDMKNNESNEGLFSNLSQINDDDAHAITPSLSVPSQVKQSLTTFEHTRTHLWRTIKTLITKQQKIKSQESEFVNRLQSENEKRFQAQSDKKQALQESKFEEAARLKNVINSCQTNIHELNHKLRKCSSDLASNIKSKSKKEEIFVAECLELKQVLISLFSKHLESKEKYINVENERIDNELNEICMKLERIERELQLNSEDIERNNDGLSVIESKISVETQSVHEQLLLKNEMEAELKLEIMQMKNELILKEKELKNIDIDIHSLDDEINECRDKYKIEIRSIEQQKNRYISAQKEFLETQMELNDMRDELNGQRVNAKNVELDYEQELLKIQSRMYWFICVFVCVCLLHHLWNTLLLYKSIMEKTCFFY